MEFTGEITDISRDYKTNKFKVTFSMNEASAINEVEKIKDCDKISVKAVQYRKKRSLNANGLLWACIGQIADALPKTDKWSVYLELLKKYGQSTYICVKPNVVEAVKAQWRECEELGPIKIGGQDAVQLLCYFGSSTYNIKEFSVLLDGCINEMEQMGLQPPTSEEMKRSLELWEKEHMNESA